MVVIFFNFTFCRKPDVLALFWCIICLVLRDWNLWKLHINLTPQNYLFSVVLKELRIFVVNVTTSTGNWRNLLKKSLMENFIFCATWWYNPDFTLSCVKIDNVLPTLHYLAYKLTTRFCQLNSLWKLCENYIIKMFILHIKFELSKYIFL